MLAFAATPAGAKAKPKRAWRIPIRDQMVGRVMLLTSTTSEIKRLSKAKSSQVAARRVDLVKARDVLQQVIDGIDARDGEDAPSSS